MKTITIIKSAMFYLSTMVLFVPQTQATEISGVQFMERIKDEGVQMELQGAGLKSVVFIKAFAAGFYTSSETSNPVLGQFPKRIEVEYFVSIPASKMSDFTVKSMKDNISMDEFNLIRNEVKSMKRYFVDLEPGDRYSLTFIPGVGTKFVHNGQLVGTIQGEVFAKALFSTWLGQKPFDKKLKKKILGQYDLQLKDSRKIAKRIRY